MKLHTFLGSSLLAAACLLAGGSTLSVAHAGEYSFKVHNGTDDLITKILVSQNKKSWGFFKIGKGIKAGGNVNLVWDKSTDNEACEQWVKAVFNDGSESKPAKFDFCEDDLEIEF
jgi:hypothetical protein